MTETKVSELPDKISFHIDGNDGTGKTTLVDILRTRYPHYEFFDRNILTKLTDVYPDKLENIPYGVYIILDASIETCLARINAREKVRDKYDTYESISKYRNRYRRLAIRYQTYFISTEVPIDKVVDIVSRIVENRIDDEFNRMYKLPNPDLITREQFESLPTIIEGNSKIIKNFDSRFNLIGYKPTVYSHTQQREGVVDGTDVERMMMTRDILYLFDIDGIPHAYWYVGNHYVLCEKISKEDIPPIEVVVKRCLVGSDKHRYYGLEKLTTRHGTSMITDREHNEYNKIYVRFDYRNPNRHPDTGLPLGDYPLADELADELINVEKARDLAKLTFISLMHHFTEMGIYFEDVCFMITTDGSKHYSEVSQDCGRYKKIDCYDACTAVSKHEKQHDLDKDVWRRGGSHKDVIEKWHLMTEITHTYVMGVY